MLSGCLGGEDRMDTRKAPLHMGSQVSADGCPGGWKLRRHMFLPEVTQSMDHAVNESGSNHMNTASHISVQE